VSWGEFKASIIMGLGVTEEDAKVAYEMMDENGDGVLSKEEPSSALPGSLLS
jgi:hypothetical protein